MHYSVSVIQNLDVLLLKEFLGGPIKLINSLTETERLKWLKLGTGAWHIIKPDNDLVEFFDFALIGIFFTFFGELFS